MNPAGGLMFNVSLPAPMPSNQQFKRIISLPVGKNKHLCSLTSSLPMVISDLERIYAAVYASLVQFHLESLEKK